MKEWNALIMNLKDIEPQDLFIDSSTTTSKPVLLLNGNKFAFVPIAHASRMIEN